MIVHIAKDSMYPVYMINEHLSYSNVEIELTESEIKEFERVSKEFHEWQNRIEIKVGIAQKWPSLKHLWEK